MKFKAITLDAKARTAGPPLPPRPPAPGRPRPGGARSCATLAAVRGVSALPTARAPPRPTRKVASATEPGLHTEPPRVGPPVPAPGEAALLGDFAATPPRITAGARACGAISTAVLIDEAHLAASITQAARRQAPAIVTRVCPLSSWRPRLPSSCKLSHQCELMHRDRDPTGKTRSAQR